MKNIKQLLVKTVFTVFILGLGFAEWEVPAEESQYDADLLATARGAESNREAQIQFQGNIKVDFRQSANNDAGYGPNQIHWINSILQQSNSTYREGMSSLQRIVIANIDATSNDVHTLQFGHQFSKGGRKAYDFLTGNTPDALTGWNKAYENANGIASETIIDAYQCYEELGPPAGLVDLCNSLHTITSSNLASADPNVFDVELPNDPFPGVQQRIDAYEAIYGNRYMRIYGNQPITNAYFERIFHSDDDFGDSYVKYNLVVVTTSSALIFELAGHLAVGGSNLSAPINWGPGQGAGSTNGGPYHFRLYGLGGAPVANTSIYDLEEFVSLGAQDNQIMADDIIPVCDEVPTITYECSSSVEENPNLGCNPTTDQIETALCTITVTSNCDEDITYTITTDTIVGPGCTYTLTRGTVAVDRYGNTATGSRSVSYKLDLDAPVLTASGSVEDGANLGGNPTAEEIEAALGSATAFDVCDGDLPVIVTDGDLVIDGCNYSQTRTFTALDDCGNESSISRTIYWIVDLEEPVICNRDDHFRHNCRS